MNTEPTLFTLYKRFINRKVAAGETTYTAAQLNRHVGCYENTTPWKRASNNPYYTTRGYQTLLKHLGCITPVKRGLWSINGSIPEWFGSFHFTGLKGGYDLNNTYADHTCMYWKQLPLMHKINPWQGVVDSRIEARRVVREAREYEQVTLRRGESITAELDGPDSTPYASPKLQSLISAGTTGYRAETAFGEELKGISHTAPVLGFSNIVTETGQISTTVGYRVTTGFGQELDCTSWVTLFVTEDGSWDGEVIETAITLVSNPGAKYQDIINVLNVLEGVEATKVFLENLDKFAINEVLSEHNAMLGKSVETKAPEVVGAKTYTLAEVEYILSAYMEFIVDDLESNIDNACRNVDADDVVELDWDRYSKSMDISLDKSSLSSRLSSDVEANIREISNNFIITIVELS